MGPAGQKAGSPRAMCQVPTGPGSSRFEQPRPSPRRAIAGVVVIGVTGAWPTSHLPQTRGSTSQIRPRRRGQWNLATPATLHNLNLTVAPTTRAAVMI